MKKSSLLHNPKDMLSRSFKPAKCKTALKLAASRMKLLKNKKEVQIKQMKRELAQLLESGQDQTARIRIEHVIREEKMMAAYELLDIYCELIVARLPIIESQKECPIDLKEAITSVIFASPRCGDVPELLDARKLLSVKYGKEFVSAAIELRPNCGVSRLMVEKLSANAPDGQTKIKALTKIAEEHNIKWDPNSFGQSDILPHDDLLNGPKTFEATTVHPVAPHPTPNFEAPPSHHKTDSEYSNFPQQNVRSSTGSHDFGSGHNSVSNNTTSSIPQAQIRPLGVRQEKGQVSQSFQGEGSSSFNGQQVRKEREQVGQSFQGEGSSSFSGQGWNMEFTDATAAAQAAAESAERASMAARAAAELSSRVQTSTGPHFSSAAHNSIDDVRRDKKTAKHETSKHNSDYISEDSARSTLSGRQPVFQNKPTDVTGQENRERPPKSSYKDGHHRGNGHGHIASPRSEGSVLDETFAHSVQGLDGNLRKSVTKEEEIIIGGSMERQSEKSEAQGMTHLREGFGAENFAYSGEEMIREQSRILSSSSHASVSGSDDEFSNFGHEMSGYDAGKGFLVGNDEQHNARYASPHGYDAAASASVIFDDSGSDGEDIWSATGSKLNEELNLHFAPPGRNSPSNLSTNSGNERLIHTTVESAKNSMSEFSTRKHSFAEFSESSGPPADGPQEDNFGPVTFDDSDGASSENEALHSEHGETEDSRYPVSRQNESLEFSGSEIHRNASQKKEIIVGSSEKFISDESPSRQSSSRLGKSRRESSSTGMNEVQENMGSTHIHSPQLDNENSDDGMELNFKKLTGGLRQKGYVHPPYKTSQLDDTSTISSSGVSDNVPTTIRQSSAASTVEGFTNTGKSKRAGNGKSSRMSNYYSDSDSDSSMEELKEQPASLRQKPGIQNVRKDVKTSPSLRGSVPYFDSKSSDSEDDSGKQVVSGKSHMGSEFSRRTKPSMSSSTSVSNRKSGSGSQVVKNSDSESERTPTTRFSRVTPQESLYWNRNSDHRPKSELPSTGRVASKATVSNPKAGPSSQVPENPDSGSGRTHATRFFPEAAQEPLYWNQNSDQRSKSEQTSSGRVASKASFVSQISSPEENQKSSVEEPPAIGGRKVEKSESTENEKAPSGTTLGRVDSSKKPSHVHPKLPDYDTLAARLQTIRTNRQ